jgi:hypothetical protein
VIRLAGAARPRDNNLASMRVRLARSQPSRRDRAAASARWQRQHRRARYVAAPCGQARRLRPLIDHYGGTTRERPSQRRCPVAVRESASSRHLLDGARGPRHSNGSTRRCARLPRGGAIHRKAPWPDAEVERLGTLEAPAGEASATRRSISSLMRSPARPSVAITSCRVLGSDVGCPSRQPAGFESSRPRVWRRLEPLRLTGCLTPAPRV